MLKLQDEVFTGFTIFNWICQSFGFLMLLHIKIVSNVSFDNNFIKT